MKNRPALILNFLFTNAEWQKIVRHVKHVLHREIDRYQDITEVRDHYKVLHEAISRADTIHSRFAPKNLADEKLARLGRYKLKSLDIPNHLWQKGFFIIIPPWEPSLEIALLQGLETYMPRENYIPVAIAVPTYNIACEDEAPVFSINDFQLRRNIYISQNGKIQAKRQYLNDRKKSELRN